MGGYIIRFSRSTKGLKNDGSQIDIEKFDGTGDFRLWGIKMRDLLIQHGCAAALEVLPADMEAQTKAELNKKAHIAVILCLGNKKGLSRRGMMGEGLYVRGRTDRRDLRQSREKSRSKSRGGRLKCYVCQSEDHLKRNCPKNNRKKSSGYCWVTIRSGRSKVLARIFGCVAYPHDKQGKLEPRAIKCVLLGYPEGVKGYRLYRLDDESPKIVTSRNVVFNESVMYKDTLKDFGASDKSDEELHVKVRLQRLHNHALEEDQTDQEDGDCEDAWDQATDQLSDLTDYQLVRDREPRTRTKPLRFQDESNMAAYTFVAAEKEDTHEPLTYQEAVAYHLAGQKLVSYKWLFKIKEGIEGVQKPRYMPRLVARGFTQRAGIDYNEVFSPVVRHISIRVILALTACKDYELEQLDVKTAFLHENLEEVIYMKQPPGYEQVNKVRLLKKSLYGLKQSPRQWSYAPCEYIYLLLYVDDMLIAYKSKAEIGSTKYLLKKEFDVKELEEANKFLVWRSIDNRKSVKMSLGGHFKLSLKDCPVRDCDVERMSKVPYTNTVGSLIYLMVCTRPDIAYAVSVVSRYLANPDKNHWEAVKWILKYLRGTANVGLVYGTNRGNYVDVAGFVDSDYAKDPNKCRYITGYAFLVQGCVVSWKATLQYVVSLSTTEAEYMALTEAVKEAIWLRGLLEELGVELNNVAVNCDNQGEIHLSWNLYDPFELPAVPPQTKHVFHVSNDDTAAAQKRLEDKQPEEKTNTDCLSGLSKVFWAEDTTMSTYLVNRSPSSAIEFKKPIDMNMGFHESGEYKKTFIGSGVGTGSVQVLQGVEFEVEPREDHTF
nr:retrotransposon protein, putative, Ty1-copia subclass [Tanacetum cinerariifolium]